MATHREHLLDRTLLTLFFLLARFRIAFSMRKFYSKISREKAGSNVWNCPKISFSIVSRYWWNASDKLCRIFSRKFNWITYRVDRKGPMNFLFYPNRLISVASLLPKKCTAAYIFRLWPISLLWVSFRTLSIVAMRLNKKMKNHSVARANRRCPKCMKNFGIVFFSSPSNCSWCVCVCCETNSPIDFIAPANGW